AGRRPPRPDPREGSEEDRARSHGDPPGGAVGVIRPSAHLARPARMRGPQAAVRALPPPLPVAPAAVPTMNEIHTHWFDPVTLYRDGYPDEITSALRVSPLLRDVVREETAALAPELVLEIGPGDMPACAGLAKVVFLDVAQVFLRSLDGLRVRADL